MAATFFNDPDVILERLYLKFEDASNLGKNEYDIYATNPVFDKTKGSPLQIYDKEKTFFGYGLDTRNGFIYSSVATTTRLNGSYMAKTYDDYKNGLFNQYYNRNRSFTIDFWIYVFDSSDKARYIVYWIQNINNPNVILVCKIYKNKITICDYAITHSVTVNEIIENNKLYHIAIICNDNAQTIIVAINGKLHKLETNAQNKITTLIDGVNANTFTFTQASLFKIGGLNTTSNTFNGIISNFRMCSFLRWTHDFDPYQIYNDKPISPIKFTVDKHTKALLHFDDPNDPLKDEISTNKWSYNYNFTTGNGSTYNLGDTPPIMDVKKYQYVDKAIFLDSAHNIILNKPLFSLFGENDRKDFTVEMFFRPYKYYYVNEDPLGNYKMIFIIDYDGKTNYEVFSYGLHSSKFITQVSYNTSANTYLNQDAIDLNCEYASWFNIALCYKYNKNAKGHFYWFSNGRLLFEKESITGNSSDNDHPYDYIANNLNIDTSKYPLYITIGGSWQQGSKYAYNFSGYLAELRVSDICRYTEDYSVEEIDEEAIIDTADLTSIGKRIVTDDQEQRNRYIRCYEYR